MALMSRRTGVGLRLNGGVSIRSPMSDAIHTTMEGLSESAVSTVGAGVSETVIGYATGTDLAKPSGTNGFFGVPGGSINEFVIPEQRLMAMGNFAMSDPTVRAVFATMKDTAGECVPVSLVDENVPTLFLGAEPKINQMLFEMNTHFLIYGFTCVAVQSDLERWASESALYARVQKRFEDRLVAYVIKETNKEAPMSEIKELHKFFGLPWDKEGFYDPRGEGPVLSPEDEASFQEGLRGESTFMKLSRKRKALETPMTDLPFQVFDPATIGSVTGYLNPVTAQHFVFPTEAEIKHRELYKRGWRFFCILSNDSTQVPTAFSPINTRLSKLRSEISLFYQARCMETDIMAQKATGRIYVAKRGVTTEQRLATPEAMRTKAAIDLYEASMRGTPEEITAAHHAAAGTLDSDEQMFYVAMGRERREIQQMSNEDVQTEFDVDVMANGAPFNDGAGKVYFANPAEFVSRENMQMLQWRLADIGRLPKNHSMRHVIYMPPDTNLVSSVDPQFTIPDMAEREIRLEEKIYEALGFAKSASSWSADSKTEYQIAAENERQTKLSRATQQAMNHAFFHVFHLTIAKLEVKEFREVMRDLIRRFTGANRLMLMKQMALFLTQQEISKLDAVISERKAVTTIDDDMDMDDAIHEAEHAILETAAQYLDQESVIERWYRLSAAGIKRTLAVIQECTRLRENNDGVKLKWVTEDRLKSFADDVKLLNPDPPIKK